MKILLALLFACSPSLAGAAEGPQAEVYRDLARGLLKNCSGTGQRIGVANFSYPDGRKSGDGDVISERITTELVRLKKFRVAERSEIENVFSELKLQASGLMGADSVKSVGVMIGADRLILGTLTQLEDGSIEVHARLVGVESGEITNAMSVKVKKDWLDKPLRDGSGGEEIKKSSKLEEYDNAIRKYMDEKAGKKNQVVKEPPSF
jgi:curli biogenesis system outer membrane secretion channel CsgG